MTYAGSANIPIDIERESTGTGIHRRFGIPVDIDLNDLVPNGVETIMCSMCEDLAVHKLVCEHQLCAKCFSNLHVCPKHRGGLDIVRSQVRRLNYISEPVQCPKKHNGCKMQVRLDELNIHLGSCCYNLTNCVRCGQEMLSYELEYHLSTSCDWLTEDCPFCSIIMLFPDLRKHLKRCPRRKHARCKRLALMREFKCRTTMCLKQCFRKRLPGCVTFSTHLWYSYARILNFIFVIVILVLIFC